MSDERSDNFGARSGPQGVWPPPPHRGPSAKFCPKCGRTLLSTLSILCNWCGARIDDPEYLERAAEERAALDAKVRDKMDQELDETARMGIFGRLKVKAKTSDYRKGIELPPDATEIK